MSQENILSSPLETLSTPEASPYDAIESNYEMCLAKASSLATTPERENKARSLLTNIRNAALLALLLNATPAFGEETDTEVPISPPTIEAPAEVKVPDTLEPNPLPKTKLEKKVDVLKKLTASQTAGVTDMLTKALEQKVEEKRKQAESMASSETTLMEKIDAGLDVVNTVPGKFLGKAAPILSVLTKLRELQKDIEEGKSGPELLGKLLMGIANAKTFGIAEHVFDAIKNNKSSPETNVAATQSAAEQVAN